MADAAGPDTFSFEDLLRLLAYSMGVRRWFLHTPPHVGLALTGLVGLLMHDMALTHDEVEGLMDGLLTSGDAPTGTTSRERGRARETVRVRAAAQLPRVGDPGGEACLVGSASLWMVDSTYSRCGWATCARSRQLRLRNCGAGGLRYTRSCKVGSASFCSVRGPWATACFQ